MLGFRLARHVLVFGQPVQRSSRTQKSLPLLKLPSCLELALLLMLHANARGNAAVPQTWVITSIL